jgi:hypothetical protein
VVKKVNWTDPENKVAGVIGSIDKNKQTHKSIRRAAKDGFPTIKIFGEVTDRKYFEEEVKPAMGVQAKVTLEGHQDDPEAMYGQISAVYHSSLSETYGLVEAECRLSGIPFNGTSNGQDIIDTEEILERWRKIL